tara:strand:- start:214042 stop:214644 length:603 start_codon:yes stop_codon:yes gene_type:complete
MRDKTYAMREMQNKSIRKRAELIKQVLKQMERNRIKPESFTLISEYVSERLSEAEDAPCSASTIRRNKTYRELLQGFMRTMGYEEEKDFKILSNNVLSLQLRVRELEKENYALEKTLKQTLSDLAISNDNSNSNITKPPSNKLSHEMSQACSIMFRMMEELDAFEIDMSAGEVVDTVSMVKSFTRDEFPEFFQWYKENII